MEVHSLLTPALGDTSYLVVHEGKGVVVDPQRDLGRFLDKIDETGAAVTHVLDTHLHNDYLSGARALAGRLGADLVMPAAAATSFPFVPAFHFEDIEVEAGLSIRPIHTPGHTPEHVSYLVLVGGEPLAIFSGGSLLVGSAGRSDLLGREYAETLAALQFRSVRRLAALPDGVGLYPTHGSGSFCTVSSAGGSASTIGQERATNPVLAHEDVATFVTGQLGALIPYPRYYAQMAPLNRLGPAALEEPSPPVLGQAEVASALGRGAALVDARSRERYAEAHYPGSLNVEGGDSFAPWVGWLVPFGTPVVLVVERAEDGPELAVELGRIGYEVAGLVTDPVELPSTRSSRTATLDELVEALGEQTVLDVREGSEWRSGHLKETVHRYVPDLVGGPPLDGEVWVICASGFRSAIAAGLVERLGGDPVVVTPGGVEDLLRRRPDLAVT